MDSKTSDFVSWSNWPWRGTIWNYVLHKRIFALKREWTLELNFTYDGTKFL